MSDRHEFGVETEERAVQWFVLHRKGKLISRNFRRKVGEIDLIFEEEVPETSELELVFVEVRGRSSVKSWISGPEGVTIKKRKRLQKAASLFLNQYCGKAKTIRFDFLFWNGDAWNYIPNVWI
jgi:Holliday junction resolvase-like predicted endonuclease